MACTVNTIYDILDAFAPFASAVPSDNVGILVGSGTQKVQAVLTALDVTPAVIDEARALDAQLIVTHHPIFFSPIRRLVADDPQAQIAMALVRANLSLLAAHTNLDLAQGGVNDVLAAQLGWPVTHTEGFLRLGQWDEAMSLEALRCAASDALHGPVLRYGPVEKPIRRFAICCGSGGSEVANAARLGSDLLLTGEIKHSQALEAMQYRMAVLCCGHWETEICAADLLCKHLQSAANTLELNIRVYVSKANPFV